MKGTKIAPLFDNILIQPLKADAKTASGIILPDSVKEKPQLGMVKAVGNGKTDKHGKLITMEVKPGDKVLYKKWGGNEIKVEGEEWIILSQEDVLSLVN